MARNFVIAIDFDGTIADHCFPEIGVAVPGAFKWMKAFQKAGAKLIIWTMRNDRLDRKYLSEAVAFCKRRGVQFWGHNTNPEQIAWTQSPKAYANCYVDDASIGCPLIPSPTGKLMVDWSVVGPAVMELIKATKAA